MVWSRAVAELCVPSAQGAAAAQVRGGIAASGCQLLRSLAAAKQAVAGCKCPNLRERSCGTSLSGGMKYKNKFKEQASVKQLRQCEIS